MSQKDHAQGRKFYLAIRRWVDADFRQGINPMSPVIAVMPTFALLLLFNMKSGTVSNAVLMLTIVPSVPPLLFVLWRGWRVYRAARLWNERKLNRVFGPEFDWTRMSSRRW